MHVKLAVITWIQGRYMTAVMGQVALQRLPCNTRLYKAYILACWHAA